MPPRGFSFKPRPCPDSANLITAECQARQKIRSMRFHSGVALRACRAVEEQRYSVTCRFRPSMRWLEHARRNKWSILYRLTFSICNIQKMT